MAPIILNETQVTNDVKCVITNPARKCPGNFLTLNQTKWLAFRNDRFYEGLSSSKYFYEDVWPRGIKPILFVGLIKHCWSNCIDQRNQDYLPWVFPIWLRSYRISVMWRTLHKKKSGSIKHSINVNKLSQSPSQ